MEQLRELTSIITPEKLNGLKILGQENENNINEFYNLLADSTPLEEKIIARRLLGKTGKGAAYQTLKADLKRQLIDMLFMIDANQSINGDAALAYEEAWRQWSAANLMLLKNALSTGIEYAEKALRLALQYQHLDLVLQVTKVLRKIYSTYLGNEQQFHYYNDLYKTYELAAAAEAKAEESYARMLIAISQPSVTAEEVISLGQQLFSELEPLLTQYSFFSIHRYTRYVQISYLLQARRYEETIAVCETTNAFFRTQEVDLSASILGINSYQIICYTQLRKLERGRQCVEESLALLKPEIDINFFKINELGFLLFLYTQAYQEAYSYCQKIVTHSKFKFQSNCLQETWLIYQAFIQILIMQGKVIPQSEDAIFTRKKLAKPIRRTPAFDATQRSRQVPLLLAQLLFTLEKKEYDQSLQILAVLEKHVGRYIRQNAAFRTNCFIHMLLQIRTADFHIKATERYAEKYYKKLISAPLELANQADEIEIIPYENLWMLFLQALPTKRIKIAR